MSKTTCYVCSAKATSREHAPAKCFFPKGQRKQLINVPSCHKHNGSTSPDDEFIRNIFIGLTGLKHPDKEELLGKTFRSFTLSPKMREQIRSSMGNVTHQGRQYWTVRLNWKRLEALTHKIACALHYKHYGKHFSAETSTVMRAGVPLSDSPDTVKLFGFVENAKLKWMGENPDIFKYQMLGEGIVPSTFRFIFYGDIDIIVCPMGNPAWLKDPNEPMVLP